MLVMLSGCASTNQPPLSPGVSQATSTPTGTSTHSLQDWLVNYETYGASYEKTITFDAYDEVITGALGTPNSDNVWSVVLYAEKGWQDGKPHRFYLQIGRPELGGLGGSYSYKHYGPYTDTITALTRDALTFKKGDKLSERVYLFSDLAVTSSSTP